MSSVRTIRATEGVVTAGLDDETILLHVASGVYYGLNAVGTRIWQLLLDGRDEDQIVETLLGEYRVAPAQLRTDVDRLVGELEAKGLLQVTGA